MATIGLGFTLSANAQQMASGINAGVVELQKLGYAAKKTQQDVATLKAIELSRAFISGVQLAANSFTAFVAGSASAVASIDDLSKRTGVSTQALQSYQFAAEQSGVSVETFGKGIQKLGVNLGEAQTGNKAAIKSFSDLGLSVADLSRLAPQDAFEQVAAAISQLPNPAQQAAAAVSLFGKSGAELVPVFQEGAGFLEQMRAEAERLGLVLNKDQVQGLARLDDSIQKVSASFKAFGARLVAELSPQLIAAAESAATFVAGINIGDVAESASAALGGLVSVAEAVGNAFLIVYQATAPLAATVLPVIADTLSFIASNFTGIAGGATAAAAALGAYALATGGAALATGVLTTAITALLSSTGIGVLVVAFGALAGAAISYAVSANSAGKQSAAGFAQAQAAINATFGEVEKATQSVKRFGQQAEVSFKIPAEITDQQLLQGTIDKATDAFKKFAQEAGTLSAVPKDVALAYDALQVAIDNVNRSAIDQSVGQELIADNAAEVLALVQRITDARAAERKATEDVAAAARQATEDARKRVQDLAATTVPESEKSRLTLMQDMLAIQQTIADAEQQLRTAQAAGDSQAISAASERLRITRETADAATRAAQEQARGRDLTALGLDTAIIQPVQTLKDQFLSVRQAFDRGIINGSEATQALRNLAAEGIAIRQDIAAELARPSSQALQANDLRTSSGASQFLSLATGREDPAIGQRREQLAKLEQIRQALLAVGANPVDILGGA